jgi:hypothetical protein
MKRYPVSLTLWILYSSWDETRCKGVKLGPKDRVTLLVPLKEIIVRTIKVAQIFPLQAIYLGSMVVCFVTLRSPKPQCSQTTVLHVKLLVTLESSWWVRVHQNLVSRLFGATVWKLLIIEQFFQWKLNKIEIENCIGIWGCSSCCVVSWESLDKSDLIEFLFHNFQS